MVIQAHSACCGFALCVAVFENSRLIIIGCCSILLPFNKFPNDVFLRFNLVNICLNLRSGRLSSRKPLTLDSVCSHDFGLLAFQFSS